MDVASQTSRVRALIQAIDRRAILSRAPLWVTRLRPWSELGRFRVRVGRRRPPVTVEDNGAGAYVVTLPDRQVITDAAGAQAFEDASRFPPCVVAWQWTP